MKVYINAEDWYPVFVIRFREEPTGDERLMYEVPKDVITRYMKAVEEFSTIQLMLENHILSEDSP